MAKNGYNEAMVKAYFKQAGIPEPKFEYRFHPVRRWRADICWIEEKVILEVQGGIWTGGRHTRGASLLKEWEKINAGAGLGYRFMFCQPSDLFKKQTLMEIKKALDYEC